MEKSLDEYQEDATKLSVNAALRIMTRHSMLVRVLGHQENSISVSRPERMMDDEIIMQSDELVC